jgi:hypothetical protein
MDKKDKKHHFKELKKNIFTELKTTTLSARYEGDII